MINVEPSMEICHYKNYNAFINIMSMFRQDYFRFPIFAGLHGEQIYQISPFLKECLFDRDCVIFQQGQPAEYLYILLEGEVLIRYKPYDGPPLTVARIAPGGVFGWSAALQREVYTSDAITVCGSTAFRLRGMDLQVLYSQYPATGSVLLDRLAGVIAERLRSTHTQVLDILTRGVDPEKPT